MGGLIHHVPITPIVHCSIYSGLTDREISLPAPPRKMGRPCRTYGVWTVENQRKRAEVQASPAKSMQKNSKFRQIIDRQTMAATQWLFTCASTCQSKALKLQQTRTKCEIFHSEGQ